MSGLEPLIRLVPSNQMPRGVLSRPRLPLWPIHFPLIAPWATIISAGPERTINPPLVLARRLVPRLLEVGAGARQPAASARLSSREETRLRSVLCFFFCSVFCAGTAARTASIPSLFLFPFQALFLAVTPPSQFVIPAGCGVGRRAASLSLWLAVLSSLPNLLHSSTPIQSNPQTQQIPIPIRSLPIEPRSIAQLVAFSSCPPLASAVAAKCPRS